MYGDGVMKKGDMRKWCFLFNGGKTDAHIEVRSGCPSLITQDLKDRIDACGDVEEICLGRP
jgi:hypothetical protein